MVALFEDLTERLRFAGSDFRQSNPLQKKKHLVSFRDYMSSQVDLVPALIQVRARHLNPEGLSMY